MYYSDLHIGIEGNTEMIMETVHDLRNEKLENQQYLYKYQT